LRAFGRGLKLLNELDAGKAAQVPNPANAKLWRKVVPKLLKRWCPGRDLHPHSPSPE
jgi:hypothetical protein